MQKRLFSVLMAIVMVFSILPTFVFAQTGDTFTVEAMSGYMDKPVPVTYKVLTEDANGGTVAVSRQGSNPAIPTDTMGTLMLPDTVENNGKTYTVTEIGESAFVGCTSFNWIELPSSLTKIEESAFEGVNLYGIEIPNSVTSIGANAFKDCSELYFFLSGSKTPAKLGRDVFVNCASDLEIKIPLGTKQAYIDAGWSEDSLYEISLFEGDILDTYSNPIEGATVSVYDESGNLKGSVKTDVNGKFDATDYVEYGVEYTAKIEKSDYMSMSMNFNPEINNVTSFTYYVLSLAESSSGFSSNTVEGAPITYQILTKDETNKTGTVRLVYGPGSLWNELVTIPNTVTHDGITYTVTEIGDCAFSCHYHSSAIILPSNLTKIGKQAFEKCVANIISYYKIPSEVTDSTFENFYGDYIFIPQGTKQTYIDAGWPERWLKEISLFQGSILDTYSNPISGATVSIYDKDGNLKNSVTTDANGKFDASDNLEYGVEYTAKIEKSDYMTISRNFVADYSLSVNSIYYIPLAKSSLGFSSDTVDKAPITYQVLTEDKTSKTGTVRVVYGPGSLWNESVTIPNTVTHDGITYTVTEIGDNAFWRHSNTTSVSLPSGLETVNLNDFNLCTAIDIISNNQIPPKYLSEHGLAVVQPIVYIPIGTKQAYIDAGWPGNKLIEVGYYSLSGKVVDENGNPIVDAKVTIYNDSGYQESVYTNSDGRYSFNNYLLGNSFVNSYVANGCNKIKVEKAVYAESVVDLELFEGDMTNVEITMSLVPVDVPGDGNLPNTPVTPAPPNNPVTPTNTNNFNEVNITQTSINNTPQTGDNAQYVIYIAFGCMLIAIIAAGCLVVIKRRTNEV